MSTGERYGTAVWAGFYSKSYLVDEGINCFTTVGEVAKESGVARATARKYLDKLVDMGRASCLVTGKTRLYRRLEIQDWE